MASPAERRVTCPICQQRMKRITATHLRKHDMTMDEFREQFGDIVATESSHVMDLSDPDTMREITGRVIDFIATDAEIDEIGRQTIQHLMKDQDAALRIALNTAAVRRLSTINDLWDKLEMIRDVLLDDRRLAGMSDANLAKVYQIVEKSAEGVLNYLKSLSTDRDKSTRQLFEQTNNVVNIFSQDPSAPSAPDSAVGREKIRALMQSLVARARTDGSEASAVKQIEAREVGQERVDVDQDTAQETQAPDQEGDSGT